MKKPVKIDGIGFPTKKAALTAINEIRNRTPRILTGADDSFMRSALKNHERYPEILGPGIASIEVRWITIPGTKFHNAFIVRRIDGTEKTFGYRSCLTPVPLATRANRAMRNAINYQIVEYKRLYLDRFEQGQAPCEISGESIGWEATEVDHHPEQYVDIRDEFLASQNLTIEQIEVKNVRELGIRSDSIADPFLRTAWMSFHGNKAKFRCLKPSVHLALRKKNTDDDFTNPDSENPKDE